MRFNPADFWGTKSGFRVGDIVKVKSPYYAEGKTGIVLKTDVTLSSEKKHRIRVKHQPSNLYADFFNVEDPDAFAETTAFKPEHLQLVKRGKL